MIPMSRSNAPIIYNNEKENNIPNPVSKGTGPCIYGDQCWFGNNCNHQRENDRELCRFFQIGSCKFEDKCLYRHVFYSQQQRQFRAPNPALIPAVPVGSSGGEESEEKKEENVLENSNPYTGMYEYAYPAAYGYPAQAQMPAHYPQNMPVAAMPQIRGPVPGMRPPQVMEGQEYVNSPTPQMVNMMNLMMGMNFTNKAGTPRN